MNRPRRSWKGGLRASCVGLFSSMKLARSSEMAGWVRLGPRPGACVPAGRRPVIGVPSGPPQSLPGLFSGLLPAWAASGSLCGLDHSRRVRSHLGVLP